MSLELACFVSPHGFGHATRTIGLLQAVQRRVHRLNAAVFTTVPSSLFHSAGIEFSHQRLCTDVGLVQHDAFTEDRGQTRARLAGLLPFAHDLLHRTAELCRSARLIICDISCLGIAVGRVAGIPSLLVENFTWDWIYSQMGPDSGLEPYIDLLAEHYTQADFRIQTEPVCAPSPCDLRCGPIARSRTMPADRIRAMVSAGRRRIVLVAMGGVALDLPFLDDLQRHPGYLFIVAGQQRQAAIAENIVLLGPHSPLQHPDLINAADLLVCKSGYSTIAECQQTDTPLCRVAREQFAESRVVERYVREAMNGTVIDEDYFFSGGWLADLEEMCGRTRTPLPVNGADQAAEFLLSII